MPRHRPPTKSKNSVPVKTLIGAVVLVIAAVASLASWFSLNAETGDGKIGPQLAVNTERIDLGKQPFDKLVRAEFKITNHGDRTLTLDASSPIRVVEGC